MATSGLTTAIRVVIPFRCPQSDVLVNPLLGVLLATMQLLSRSLHLGAQRGAQGMALVTARYLQWC